MRTATAIVAVLHSPSGTRLADDLVRAWAPVVPAVSMSAMPVRSGSGLAEVREQIGCMHGRGSKPGYSWSRVDVAGSGDGILTFTVWVRDGSICWRSGEAAGERP